MGGGISIANETEIPLVYVIAQAGPLYWGVIQPGQEVTRKTGKVWFTIKCYPYDGSNEPTNGHAAACIIIPTLASIAAVLSFGAAAPAAGTLGTALTAASSATTATIMAKNGVDMVNDIEYATHEKDFEKAESARRTGPLKVMGGINPTVAFAARCFDAKARYEEMARELVKENAARVLICVTKHGHYPNGDWIHVRGGIKKGQDPSTWKPMYFAS